MVQMLMVVAALALGVVPGSTTRVEYTGNGSTKTFAFSFKTQATSHVKVYVNGALQSSGYTATLSTNQDATPGGSVTFTTAPISGAAVKIERTVPLTQATTATTPSMKPWERGLDYRTMAEQQLERRIIDHEVTADAVAAAANSSTPVTAAGSSVARKLEDWFRDRYSVLGFIPANLHAGIRARTETTDLTAYINVALGVVGSGTLYFPAGKYQHSGIALTAATQIECESWDYNSGGATLYNTSSVNHGISIVLPATTGARVRNCHIRGNRDTDPATQASGIYIHSEGNNSIEHNYITFAKHGIELYGHTSSTRILGNRVQQNLLDGLYGRTEVTHQLNSILVSGNEFSSNLRHGVSLWANNLNLINNAIQANGGAGFHLSGDDMSTANASVTAVRVAGNYFEQNQLGAIKALATDNAPTYHYVLGLWITNNFITEPHALSTTVTAAIDLDCTRGSGNRCYTGSYSYDGVVVADNYVTTSTTIAFVDFHNVQGRRTVLSPFYGSYSSLTAFGDLYKGTSNVFVRDSVYRSGASAPSTSADYVGQVYLNTGDGTWTRSRGAGLGASDWLSGASPVLQVPQDPNHIVSTSALNDAAVWYATTTMVTANVDGAADAVVVGTSVNASLNQAYNGVTAGESYLFAFDAKNNGGTVAELAVYDATNGDAAIVAPTSYFSQLNGSTYTRVLTSFQVPAGCTSVKVFPVIAPSLAGATNVLIQNVALNKLGVGFAKFATGSATISNGQQTVTSDLSSYRFTSAPPCTATGITSNRAYKVTTTTALLTIDAGSVLGGDETVNFTCIGQ